MASEAWRIVDVEGQSLHARKVAPVEIHRRLMEFLQQQQPGWVRSFAVTSHIVASMARSMKVDRRAVVAATLAEISNLSRAGVVKTRKAYGNREIRLDAAFL